MVEERPLPEWLVDELCILGGLVAPCEHLAASWPGEERAVLVAWLDEAVCLACWDQLPHPSRCQHCGRNGSTDEISIRFGINRALGMVLAWTDCDCEHAA